MKKIVLLTGFIMLLSVFGFSQNAEKRIKEFNLEYKVGIQGYDPVAYFVQSKSLKGRKEISAVYDGVVYYFSSNENKELFLKKPSKYEPQYGGWCAFAMGDSGDKVEINPTTFKIVDGKLYLFYNAYFTNTLKSWNKNQEKLKSKADENWRKFFK